MAKKAANTGLQLAKINKKDEFYTQLTDIEKEMKHYKQHFVDKTIYCNCDDPEWSNFFRYFALNFEHLKLKKLIATHFVYSDLFVEGETYKLEITRELDLNDDGRIDLSDIVRTKLKDNGDFRSEECIEFLKEADIVVTNPPFSLFREYVAQLIEYDKKFIIIGHQNAISYREIFKLMQENKLWLGYGFVGGAGHFINTQYEDYATAGDHKEGMIRVSGVHWFTNLDITKRHENLLLYKNYSPEEYQTYENFNAINVDKTKDIPVDYKGFIGVPITFLDKYNPDQFEIVGLGISNSGLEIGVQPYTKEHKKYRKEVQQRGAVNGDLYMMVNGVVTVPYARVIIKNKQI